ncbi:hypothetical protein COU91_03175 [Candidatus Saccharibacteria bacterium CG10_big_fil_rev_8_21_14_0_10_47_8]|nr:MAG: hypothetical protein COU91_03175 [Candidatus Saccharibacteria bacterium CG10_big_fil_rev_8_21_14_0_10_47_8]
MARSRQVAGAKMTIDGIYNRACKLISDLGLYTQNYPFEWCEQAHDLGSHNSGPQMALYTAGAQPHSPADPPALGRLLAALQQASQPRTAARSALPLGLCTYRRL